MQNIANKRSGKPTTAAYDTIVEALRLGFGGDASSRLSIGFTAATQHAGVTTVATNVAIRAAEQIGDVLLVDANFGRPSVSRKLRIRNRNTPGLANLLAGDAEPADCVSNTDVQGLSVLAPGRIKRNRNSVFDGVNLHAIVESLKFEYRLLIFDLPVLGQEAYAGHLAPLLDGVLLVVAAGGCRRDLVQLAKRQLEDSGGTTLGVVFNKA